MITPEIEELKNLVNQRYNRRLSTTTDFEEFSLYLKRRYDIDISTSTLKRLYGYVNDLHKPRMQTLDSLAGYLGYNSYASFVEWLKRTVRFNSSFFNAEQIVSSDLEIGDQIEIGWAPNRLLRLRFLGDSTYCVLESQNSKVMAGDTFITGCFIIGQPLYLPYLERNGERTSSFVAGRNGGLSIARIIKQNNNE